MRGENSPGIIQSNQTTFVIVRVNLSVELLARTLADLFTFRITLDVDFHLFSVLGLNNWLHVTSESQPTL